MSEPEDPTNFNHPERNTLNEYDVASLGQAVLTLTKEVWVLTDRIHVLEAVLAKHDLDIRDEIDQFQPDEAMTEKLHGDATAMIERVLAALSKD